MSLSSACGRCSKQTVRQFAPLSNRIRHYATVPSLDRPSREAQNLNGQHDRDNRARKTTQRDTGYRQPEELLTYFHRSEAPQRKNRPDARHTKPFTKPLHVNARPERERPSRPLDEAHVKLVKLLEQDDLKGAWEHYQENYALKSFTSMMQSEARETVLREFVVRLTEAWTAPLRNVAEPFDMPSPLEVLNTMRSADLAKPTFHRRVLWTLAKQLELAMETNPELWKIPRANVVMEEAMILLSQWIHGGWDHQRFSEFDQAPTTFRLLSDEQLNIKRRVNGLPSFPVHLEALAPAFNKLTNHDRIPESAKAVLLLHDVLKHSIERPDSFSKYDEFVKDFDEILINCQFPQPTSYVLIGNLKHMGIEEEAATTIVRRILRRSGTSNTALIEAAGSDHEESIEAVCERCRARLARAVVTENLDQAEKIWKDALPFLESEAVKTSNHADVMKTFEAFLLSFSSLRRPGHTLDVWNMLVSNGYQPTVVTWTVMLKSCHIGRAYNTLQEIWQRMRRAGIQPDAHAWAARIIGLLRSGRVPDGFKALDEMGQEWIQEVRRMNQQKKSQKLVVPPGDINGIPKPNIVILNSAISGLAISKRSDEIIRAINWSRQYGIEPDVITYNTLLSVSLSRGDNAEATAILTRMSATGIAPDSATFTILLNSLFIDNALTTLPFPDQERLIFDFIRTVESSSVPLHDKSYTIIIDRLTKEARNIPLVHKVLSHMKKRNVLPSAHVYTVLMTHYFQSDPPDLDAVDTLYEQILARPRYQEVLDTIFYDRMVEGFARIGELGRMMTFLTRMGKEGKRPGWLAMGAVVKSLAEAGQWDRVRMVVADVRHGEGLLKAGLRGTKGQADFWEYVRGLGLDI